jgi:hypothetical protein
MSGVPASHWNMADLPNLKDMDREQVSLKGFHWHIFTKGATTTHNML